MVNFDSKSELLLGSIKIPTRANINVINTYILKWIIYSEVHHHRHGYVHVYGDIAYTSGVPYRKIE